MYGYGYGNVVKALSGAYDATVFYHDLSPPVAMWNTDHDDAGAPSNHRDQALVIAGMCGIGVLVIMAFVNRPSPRPTPTLRQRASTIWSTINPAYRGNLQGLKK